MAAEQKTSDAVRITRIVSPTVLIIALALIFKGELSNTMAGGCYEIELVQVGAVSDRSMCSKSEVEDVIVEVSNLAVQENRETAEEALKEMEDVLSAMEGELQETREKAMHLAEQTKVYQEKTFELAQEWKHQLTSLENDQDKARMSRVYNEFVAALEIPDERVEIAEVVVPKTPEVSVEQVSSDIRQRYVKSTEADVMRINNNITVRRRK